MATEKRLIRADVTVDAFTKWLTSTYDGRMPVDVVNEIPTVDAVEVVHAHWIPDDYYDICSHCNHPVVLHDRRKPDRYCRNCGAKMDGVSDG